MMTIEIDDREVRQALKDLRRRVSFQSAPGPKAG